ncbi:MAG TPA: D-cysteine desulfhydrase family protein [Polyangia bacterium]|jgi:D-cysteine desulfhydrase
MKIPYPQRLDLARTPTPLEPLKRLGAELGVQLYVKRDDLTGCVTTGNKIRKLEFLAAEALAQGCDTLMTCGGAQSNHCRATAAVAAKLGLKSCVILRVPDPQNPPPTEGNILLDRLLGAEIRWVTPEEYRRRAQVFVKVAAELQARGQRPYMIPEGGSNPLGAFGYVRCAEELESQLPPGHTTIVYAAGSGGTGAGLIMGVKLLDLPCRVVGFNVCDSRDYFVRGISEIVEQAKSHYGLSKLQFQRDDVEIIDGYVGKGYAQSRPEELALIRDVARTEGLVLDPVYTGKAFYGMVQELKRRRDALGQRIIFLHTGGVFGLFPKMAELAPLL